jgi:membrane protein
MVWMYWTSLTILVGAQVGRATRDVFEADQRPPEAAKANAAPR